MPRESVKTRTAEFFLDDDDIMHIVMLPEVLVDELDVYDNNLVIRNLSQGKKTARLFDARPDGWSMTDAAKIQAKKQFNPDLAFGIAILIKSGITSSLMNFFSRFSYHQIPTRYFTEEAEAVSWLKSLKKN